MTRQYISEMAIKYMPIETLSTLVFAQAQTLSDSQIAFSALRFAQVTWETNTGLENISSMSFLAES